MGFPDEAGPDAGLKTCEYSQHKEVEVKLRVTDRKALLRRLAALRARAVHPRMHEMNTLYDTADGALARVGRCCASVWSGEGGNRRAGHGREWGRSVKTRKWLRCAPRANRKRGSRGLQRSSFDDA